VDLTGIDEGHMNQPAMPRAWDRDFDGTVSGYAGDESDLASPMVRKRKYNDYDVPRVDQQVESGDETFPTLEELQRMPHVNQERKPVIIPELDLYGVSDREDDRRQPRKRPRYQQIHPKKFHHPSGLTRNEERKDVLPIRRGHRDDYSKMLPGDATQKARTWGRVHPSIHSTLPLESDSDEIEVVETTNYARPSSQTFENRLSVK
jgi:hypothetical protein